MRPKYFSAFKIAMKACVVRVPGYVISVSVVIADGVATSQVDSLTKTIVPNCRRPTYITKVQHYVSSGRPAEAFWKTGGEMGRGARAPRRHCPQAKNSATRPGKMIHWVIIDPGAEDAHDRIGCTIWNLLQVLLLCSFSALSHLANSVNTNWA